MKQYLHAFNNQSDLEFFINNLYDEPFISNTTISGSQHQVDYNLRGENKPNLLTRPLAFVVTNSGVLRWVCSDSAYTKTIQYSKDKGLTWSSLTSTESGTTLNVEKGDVVQFKGDNATYASSILAYNSFSASTCEFYLVGNIMSLINSTNFSGLTTLESAYTFYSLFEDCTGLTDASSLSLPATTLSDNCYAYMFYGCSGLNDVIDPSELAFNNSYYNSSIDDIVANFSVTPNLIATQLSNGCYQSMFEGCSSLTKAPVLIAETLTQNCYSQMFKDCTSLNFIDFRALDISATDCLNRWVENVAPTGTFLLDENMTTITPNSINGIPVGWPQDLSDIGALMFKVLTDGNIVWKCQNVNNKKTISYTKDNGETWTSITSAPNEGVIIPVTAGDKVAFKGNNTAYSNSSGLFNSFSGTTCEFTVKGNIMSLFDGDNYDSLYAIPASSALTNMFSHCYGLKDAKKLILPATSLTTYCYYRMFESCTGMTAFTSLPAETLATYCYQDMFADCYSLQSTPELPAPTLVDSCYRGMFQYCTGLTTAPVLSAETLVNNCYRFMFNHCTHLNYIKMMAKSGLTATDCFKDWVTNVAPSGTFVKSQENTTIAPNSVSGIPIGWSVVTDGVPTKFLKFVALEDTNFSFSGTSSANTLNYSLDNGETWTELKANKHTPTIHSGETVMWRGKCVPVANSRDNIYGIGRFVSSGRFNVEGSVMSLTMDDYTDYTIITDGHMFRNLFSGNTNVVNAENMLLPATVLKSGCYVSMFNGCTSLITAPELQITDAIVSESYASMFANCTALTKAPSTIYTTTMGQKACQSMFQNCISLVTAPEITAETLDSNCYVSMFFGCTSLQYGPSILTGAFKTNSREHCISMFEGCVSLVRAPELPETNLTNSSNYRKMFIGCTSLTVAPELPATSLTESCYDSMFSGCTALTTPPSSIGNSATTIANSACTNMFNGCTSLTGTPELPALTVGQNSYQSMFNGCSSLTTAPELPATTLGVYCYKNMFQGCTGLTTAPELPATTLGEYCYQGMFYECKSLISTPELPATTLGRDCYQSMFKYCTSLTTAPTILPATTLAERCYYQMFQGCTALTSAPALPATALTTNCYQSMFEGCSSLTTAPALPATTLAYQCYYRMFHSCSRLNYIKCLATDISATNCTYQWTYNVASTGTFVKNASMGSWAIDSINGIPTNWVLKNTTSDKYLTFVPSEDSTFKFSGTGSNTLQYSLDNGETWVALADNTDTPTVATGNTILFKGECTPTSSGIGKFISSGEFEVKGNVMSLIYNDNFRNQVSLENYDYAFVGLFSGNTNLVSAENLSLEASTLSEYCYQNMFRDCSSLTAAPELPATEMAESCYRSMFNSCTSLTTPPELRATVLAPFCFYYMFENCTSLTTAPKLPSTTLTQCCYDSMFIDCTGLTETPALPATTLASNCYRKMFAGCISLTRASELPATTLENEAYKEMFSGCTSLEYIKCLATDITASNCLTNWVVGVASAGTFVKEENMTGWTVDSVNGIPNGWTLKNNAPNTYFTFIAREDGTFKFSGSTTANTLTYSLDGGETWTALAYNTDTPTVTSGNTIMFKGACTVNNSGIGRFISSGDFDAKGNPLSLIYNDNFGGIKATNGKCFFGLFSGSTKLINAEQISLIADVLSDQCYNFMFDGCTSLITAPELPATTLANSCYSNMFRGCSSLTMTPDLPVTRLANNCYNTMFSGCTSLTTAPKLLATTLTNSCYKNMFNGCTGLTIAPEIPANIFGDSSCHSMFSGCTSLVTGPSIIGTSGTTMGVSAFTNMFSDCISLTGTPELLAVTLSNYCYAGMFSGCTSLTTAQSILPATSLTNNCYYQMFYNCTSLTTTPALPALTLTSHCYNEMFKGCSSLVNAPALPATTLAPVCYKQMFQSCTSLTTAPDLLVTTLEFDECYREMFQHCQSLNYIKCLATTVTGFYCFNSWMNGVATSGTFVKNQNMTSWTRGASGIPFGWTVEDDA